LHKPTWVIVLQNPQQWKTPCCAAALKTRAVHETDWPDPYPMRFIMQLLRILRYLFLLWAPACPAWATQAHGAPEGLYVHQLSHLFFILAMAILIYWLRSHKLVQEAGWRHIQFAAVFFALWSLDAFFVHLLDEQFRWVLVDRLGAWRLRLEAPEGAGWLAPAYYLLKLDHLLCVPGLYFLYIGIRGLSAQKAVTGENEGGMP
jgi:hypothetical protein